MTNSRPSGTLTENLISDGGFPGWTYGSFNGMPLTVTLPRVSQHFTVSPPTPTTRLIRSPSLDDGSRPMNWRNSLACFSTTGSFAVVCVCSSSSQPPGSWKTTTSPRLGFAPNHGVSLSTSTRSPTWMVCSMEPDGMTNACNRNVLSTSAISSATTIRMGTSLATDRCRLRLILRWSFRRSARPPGRRRGTSPSYGSSSRWFAARGAGPFAPRARPRLPMGGVRGRGERQGTPVGRRPYDPLGPADHLVQRDRPAPGVAEMVTGVQ
jgi:hypothetical protein